MGDNKNIKHFFGNKFAYRLVSVLLILVIVSLAGCKKDTTKSSEPVGTVSSENTDSSDNSVSSDETFSSDSSASTDSSNSQSENTGNSNTYPVNTDPVSGEYSYTETSSNTADDIDEIIPTGNTAYLSNPLDGYAEKQAEKLRKEILNTENTEKYYKITGTKYYVSALNGNDSNSGLSPDEALKTTEGLSGLGLVSGDAVLFERDSVFRLYTSVLAVEGVTYGSYGEGEKPKFYTSPVNFADVVWTPSVKKNVWQLDWVYAECGNMVFDHGKEIGYRRTSLRSLKKNTEFFEDESSGIMYLYCDKGNPANVYESIEVGLKMAMLNIPSGTDNVTVDNLCFKYGGIFAVNATWNAKGVTVTNCEMGYIGGATTGDKSGRYGNAIQLWTGSEDIICDHNWIYQTFDTAISWQGNGGEDFSYENISFSYNLLEYNNADFEYWDPDSTVKNFDMNGNIMRFTALGWGTRADDAGSRGIEGCFVGNTETMTVDNINVKNNIIDCPGRMIINWDITPKDRNTEIFVSGTKIYVNSSYRTSDEVVRGYKHADSDPSSISAVNKEEFVAALKKFDPKAVLEWH